MSRINKIGNRSMSLLAAFLLVFLGSVHYAAIAVGQVRIDTIALVGWEAPGFGPGATFSSRIDNNWNNGFFEHRMPFINNFGQVLFGGQSYSYPLGDEHDDGVWASNLDGSLRLVRRERTPASGTTSDFGECGNFDNNGFCTSQHPDDDLEILGFSDNGEAVFLSDVVGPNIRVGQGVANFSGIWSERGDTGLHLVARMGDPMPGINDTFGRIWATQRGGPTRTNASGLVTFVAEFGSDRKENGLWVEEPSGALRLVAKSGDLAPGTSESFDDFLDSVRFIDSQGTVAFESKWLNTAGYERHGIWRGAPQGITPVVLSGDPVPGTEGERVFANVYLRYTADNGNLVFSGNADQLPEDPFNFVSGLFASTASGIRKVVLSSDEIPDFAGNFFSPDSAVVDNQGRVVFTTPIDRPSRPNALYAERNGALQLIAGPESLPGLTGDETIDQIANLSTNRKGQIAFVASLESPCADANDPFQCDIYAGRHSAGEGYWMAQENGELSLIVRTGDLIEVAPGDLREVYTLSTLNGPHLSDRGQLAFMVQFLDGTQGIFRAELVPEPTSTALLLSVTIPAMFFRRKYKG